MDLKRLALYVGGFMGPFGTIVIIPMYPELETHFDASKNQVSLGFSVYVFVFAALLLISGTIGERFGRRRTVRAAYLLFACSSVLCAIAPNLWLFIAARAMQGVANAFISPLLVAGLAELVVPEKLGRELGIYSVFQALALGLGPLVGGVAADTTWQWAYVGTAFVALALAAAPPHGEPAQNPKSIQLRSLMTPRLSWLGVGFFLGAAGPLGAAFFIGIAARDTFALSGTTTGLILLAGSASALVTSPLSGKLLDLMGARNAAVLALSGAILSVGSLVLVTGPWSLAAVTVIAMAMTSFTVLVYQAIGATAMPENRGGALSFLLSFRFTGHGLGPIAMIPLLAASPNTAFLLAAALGIGTLAILVYNAEPHLPLESVDQNPR